MDSKIRRIWMAWLGAMVLLVAATWALAMVPLPGLSSSSSPTIEDVLGFFRHIGIFGTVKMIAVLFLPPIVLTYLEMRKHCLRPRPCRRRLQLNRTTPREADHPRSSVSSG